MILRVFCRGSWNQPLSGVCLPGKLKCPTKKHIPEKRQARLWGNVSAEGKEPPVCILPALCKEGACGCCLRTPPHCPNPGSAHPSVPAVIQPATSAQRAADMKATLKVPRRTVFVFDAWSQVPLRKWKEREITSKSLGRFSYKWEACAIL